MSDSSETTADIAAAAAEGAFEAAPNERDLRKHAQAIVEAVYKCDPVSQRVIFASLVVELLRLGFAEALDPDAYNRGSEYRLAKDPAAFLPD